MITKSAHGFAAVHVKRLSRYEARPLWCEEDHCKGDVFRLTESSNRYEVEALQAIWQLAPRRTEVRKLGTLTDVSQDHEMLVRPSRRLCQAAYAQVMS